MRAALPLFVLLAFVAMPATTGAVVTQNVNIVNFNFEPRIAVVQAGLGVVWSNASPSFHTVTAMDGSFNSGLMAAGATYSRAFDDPGVVTYRCTIHPSMVAFLVVVGA